MSVCLPVRLQLSVYCGKQKRWIRSIKKAKLNQNRADHTLVQAFSRPLGKDPTRESLAVISFCFCSGHGTDSLAASRQHRDLALARAKASCLMSYTHITIKCALSICPPSHHIRAFSLSFHSTEILDPEKVPDSDLGPCIAQLRTTRNMRARKRGRV